MDKDGEWGVLPARLIGDLRTNLSRRLQLDQEEMMLKSESRSSEIVLSSLRVGTKAPKTIMIHQQALQSLELDKKTPIWFPLLFDSKREVIGEYFFIKSETKGSERIIGK